MLDDSYTLVFSTEVLDKQVPDAEQTTFSKGGVPLNEALTMRIASSISKSGISRYLVDMKRNIPVVGATDGSFTTRRVYFNIVRDADDSASAVKADLADFANFISNTAFQDKLLNHER